MCTLIYIIPRLVLHCWLLSTGFPTWSKVRRLQFTCREGCIVTLVQTSMYFQLNLKSIWGLFYFRRFIRAVFIRAAESNWHLIHELCVSPSELVQIFSRECRVCAYTLRTVLNAWVCVYACAHCQSSSHACYNNVPEIRQLSCWATFTQQVTRVKRPSSQQKMNPHNSIDSMNLSRYYTAVLNDHWGEQAFIAKTVWRCSSLFLYPCYLKFIKLRTQICLLVYFKYFKKLFIHSYQCIYSFKLLSSETVASDMQQDSTHWRQACSCCRE